MGHGWARMGEGGRGGSLVGARGHFDSRHHVPREVSLSLRPPRREFVQVCLIGEEFAQRLKIQPLVLNPPSTSCARQRTIVV